MLLAAFAKVQRVLPTAHLVIAGPGTDAPIRDLATRLEVSDNVRVYEGLGDDELVAIYQACDVFALLPRAEAGFFEGFGLVFLEAGACGKPVVATRSGGVPDAVLDGETGFLVDEEDAEAAGARLLELLTNTELAATLGERGRQWAAEHSWSAYADRLVGLYRSAVTA